MTHSITKKTTKKVSATAGKSPEETAPLPSGTGSVLKQINALYRMSIKDLKEQYRNLFADSNAPPSKDFLVRRIAYKIQADAFGDISVPAKGKLNLLKAELDPLKDLGRKPNRLAKDRVTRRLPLPGASITKTYKGKLIEVKVLNKGFEYNGKPYRSLSRIAHEVTGVHQSGFVFFRV